MDFLQNIKPRKYQEEILESCKSKNCLVVLPTGLGKTLIALMLTIERMKEFPTSKIVFLAPTKPLAEQHLQSYKKNLPELFAEMELFTGAIDKTKRKKIWQTADIIFSTPQCIANDLKKELYSLQEVSLLVEDECHRCIKNYDYNFIAQKYKSQAQNPRILGLTASPGNDKKRIQQICKNLGIESVEIRTRESADVKEYLQELEFEKIMVDFPKEFEEMRHVLTELFDKYVEELKSRRVLYGPSNKTGLINLQKRISATLSRGSRNFNYMAAASACAQAIKLQHALGLLETQTLEGFHKYLKDLFNQAAKKQSKGVVKLVAKPQFNFVYSQVIELLTKKQEHPKIQKITEIVKGETSKNPESKILIFAQFRDTAAIISKNLNELGNIKSEVFIGQAKKTSSDGKTSSGLNQKKQKAMLEKFSSGEINVLCSTSIGEEGLDIPEVSAVIFYEPIPSAIRAIQRRGRTARLSKGKLIILVTKNTRDEAFYYVSRAREKSMHQAIESIQQDLKSEKDITKFEKQGRLF